MVILMMELRFAKNVQIHVKLVPFFQQIVRIVIHRNLDNLWLIVVLVLLDIMMMEYNKIVYHVLVNVQNVLTLRTVQNVKLVMIEF
jgi:hypothetical protein